MIARRVAVALFAAIAAACAPDGGDRDTTAASPADARGSQVGAVAPRLDSRTLDGNPVSLDSLRGAPVLLNVWATWCHPCRAEIPVLQALHRKHAPHGLRVIGVTIDDDGRGEEIRRFAAEFGMTYDVWHDPDQRVMPGFSVIGVPTTFLIGRDGRMLWRKTGEVKEGDPALAAAIDSALAAPAATDATS